MPRILATRSAQLPLIAEFTFNHNQWVVDTVDGAKKTLGSTVALSTDPLETQLTGPVANTIVFDAIPLPVGAVIWGGSLIVENAVTGSTAYTISVGSAASPTALLNAQSCLAVGRTALGLTVPLAFNNGANCRITVAYTVANATAGRIRIRLDYTIDGRHSEVIGA